MQGLMTLIPTNQVVGKKSEYKTKEDFVTAIREEECRDIDIESVGEGYMRYYPKGTEDSQGEFGAGVGVYMSVDKPTKGAFEVWIV
jgi:hypothetical protein